MGEHFLAVRDVLFGFSLVACVQLVSACTQVLLKTCQSVFVPSILFEAATLVKYVRRVLGLYEKLR